MQRAKRHSESLTAEGRYRLLVDAIADYAVYMLDPTGHISSWNTGAKRFKGYEAEEILGKHFSRFYTDEERDALLPDRALETARTEGKYETEGWRVRKDGSRFWAYVIIDPIYEEDGTLVGYAKVTRDLTERKEAERALEQAREALFQAQKIEAVGRLTGGIAHDFNNLLMVILASLELLRKRMPDEPRLTSLVDNAMQGAQRGATLTQRMLSFARRQQLSIETLDVADMVRDMSDLLQRSIGPEVFIETRFPIALTPIKTDANQLESALLNLVVNARDALEDGGRIIIAAREEYINRGNNKNLMPGPYVCLSVEDNGAGMDTETLVHAMEPFFTTKGPGKGTGLGLSMVHGLAMQSGGALHLISAMGKGTTVELWFPAAVGEKINVPVEVTPTPASSVMPLLILVVDDDSLVLTNTAAMLEDMGHTVFTAASGHQGLEILRRRPDVDLTLTDYAMPGMTGLQMIDLLHERVPDMPVLMATGYAELPQGVREKMPRLHKPYSQAQLAEAINNIFQKNEKAIA